MPVLQSLLGHASPETTMIYTHAQLEPARAAAEKIASILLAIDPAPSSCVAGTKELLSMKGECLNGRDGQI